jgi:uncharacterized protein
MKKSLTGLVIVVAGMLLLSCNSNTTTERTAWVLDNEHVLTQEQISSLDSLYKAHEKITSNEIALVTTADYGADSTLERFALNFGNKYGIGKKGKNNGLLIVFSNAMHQTRIATGLGTEKVLTDVAAKEIIDSLMIPHFKQGEIFEGLWEGSKAVIGFLEKPGNKIK